MDARVWGVAEVIQFFNQIENGAFKSRFDEVFKQNDFDGQALLVAEEETLKIELNIVDPQERKVILAHIHNLRRVKYCHPTQFLL